MKKSILSKVAILAVLVIFCSCRAKKPLASPGGTAAKPSQTAPTVTKTDIFKKLSNSQLQYNTLSIKAKAALDLGNNNHDVSMNIRIQKNKVIWVSVTAIAGIEVARALITPDSIKVLNRIENSYTKKPFTFIYQYASSQVDFNTLQNIFTGNADPKMLSEISTADVNGGQTHVKGDLSGLVYLLIFNENSWLIQKRLTDTSASQSVLVGYGDYGNISGQAIPQSVNISSTSSSKAVSINLKYTQITINEAIDIPFTVPKRFSVKN